MVPQGCGSFGLDAEEVYQNLLGISYKARLDKVELFPLEHQRLRGDLIEVILSNGKYSVIFTGWKYHIREGITFYI